MGYVPNLRLVVPEARAEGVKRPAPRIFSPRRRLQVFARRRSLRRPGGKAGEPGCGKRYHGPERKRKD
jgi:hypothetical protein